MDLRNFQNAPGGFSQKDAKPDMYKELEAKELYCNRCQQAVPVRKRLLLVLPEGDKYEYLCALCSESVGFKIDRQESPISVII